MASRPRAKRCRHRGTSRGFHTRLPQAAPPTPRPDFEVSSGGSALQRGTVEQLGGEIVAEAVRHQLLDHRFELGALSVRAIDEADAHPGLVAFAVAPDHFAE